MYFIIISYPFFYKDAGLYLNHTWWKMWNENNTCYAITYILNFKPFGGVGRVLRLFSNQSFFALYDKAGEKIKNSAWYFWDYQFSDLVAPEWSGTDFLNPSDSGFSGWTLLGAKSVIIEMIEDNTWSLQH